MSIVPSLKVDGLNKCIIGKVTLPVSNGQEVWVYDANKCIDTLVADGLTWADAVEYFEFNILGAYVGKGTPVFMYPYEEDDDETE